MKALLLIFALTLSCSAQGIGGTAGIGGSAGISGAAGLAATPAYVQQCNSVGQASGTALVCTLASAPPTTHCLIMAYSNLTNSTALTITETNVAWTHYTAADASNTSRFAQIYYGVVSASASATINITTPYTMTLASSQMVSVIAVSGLNSCTPSANGPTSGTSTTPAAASITPTSGQTGFLFGVARTGAALTGVGGTPTGSYTPLTLDSTSLRDVAAFRAVTSTTGSYTVTWTQGSSTTWAGTQAYWH